MEISIEPNTTNGKTVNDETGMNSPPPPAASTTSPKVVTCEICRELAAKYRCPKCNARTCSLACVKQHKTQQSCNGVKNPSEFVKLSKFDTGNLLSDYRFLESANRMAAVSERNPMKPTGNDVQKSKILTKQARLRNTLLKILPYTFTRHINNKSFYFTRKKELLWLCEFIFTCNNTSAEIKLVECLTLKEGIGKITELGVLPYNQMLMYSDMSEFEILYKNTNSPANKPSFYKLDKNKSLKDNLAFLTIIEYPTFIVIKSDDIKKYDLIEKPTVIKELDVLNHAANMSRSRNNKKKSTAEQENKSEANCEVDPLRSDDQNDQKQDETNSQSHAHTDGVNLKQSGDQTNTQGVDEDKQKDNLKRDVIQKETERSTTNDSKSQNNETNRKM